MRILSAKQKRYLINLSREGIKTVDEMTDLQYYNLRIMNDHETLEHNANRFLMDLYTDKQIKKLTIQ